MNDFTYPHGPYLIPPMRIQNSGRDFLGLLDSNAEMMGICIPGINNVVRYIRPFSVICWMVWKFHQLLENEGRAEASNAEFVRFRDKVETLFTWGSHADDHARLPGRYGPLPRSESDLQPLDFQSWQRTYNNTGLMAAVQYGPAAKDTAGLGFIRQVDINLFATRASGEEIAKNLDRILRSSTNYNLLNSLVTAESTLEQAEDLWDRWGLGAVSADEQRVFLAAFYQPDRIGDYSSDMGRRSSTIALILETLEQVTEPQTAAEIRRLMTHQNASLMTDPSLEEARHKWAALQARQLQRFAMEQLYGVLERSVQDGQANDISKVVSLYLSERAQDIAPDKLIDEYANKAQDLDAFLAEGLNDGSLCFDDRLQRLREAHRSDDRLSLLEECIHALCLVNAFIRHAKSKRHLQTFLQTGGIARLSLRHFSELSESLAQTSARVFLHDLIETLVSQHFSVAVQRFDGRAQRLRITLEEQGLTPLLKDRWSPRVTADRLETTLDLLLDCDVLSLSTSEPRSYSLTAP